MTNNTDLTSTPSANSTQTWKTVAEFPTYQVSDQGNVRLTKSNGGTRPIRPFLNKATGRMQVSLYKKPKQYLRSLHAVVLTAFAGPRPKNTKYDTYCARHLNGDAFDNSASNLVWGTYVDNARDTYKHGTAFTRSPAYSKLNTTKAQEIRVRYAEGETQMDLADEYNVSQPHISHVVNHRMFRTAVSPVIEPTTKSQCCSQCRKVRRPSKFTIARNTRTGLSTACRVCSSLLRVRNQVRLGQREMFKMLPVVKRALKTLDHDTVAHVMCITPDELTVILANN